MDRNIHELAELRDRTGIFQDRAHAGQILAGLLEPWRLQKPLVLAIPAGGVPVAAEVARSLDCPLDLAVVSKITLPWNSEAGFGAVAWDGTAALNEEMLPYLGLSPEQIAAGKRQTYAKVRRREQLFRGRRPFPELQDKTAILVDDGLASGFTMMVAVQALRRSGSDKIIVAMPTGHLEAVQRLAAQVDALCCTNIRSGCSFAVAAAYLLWRDVTEQDVLALLPEFWDMQ